jgi:predicted amidohydrolase YtcJ
MRYRLTSLFAFVSFAAATAAGAAGAEAPADVAYTNAVIFTADATRPSASALATRHGRIIYVGDAAGLAPYLGTATRRVDLDGKFVMPGLIDGHMHPLDAGSKLLECSLNYDALTIEQFQTRIQGCIDASPRKGANDWLVIVDWFQENMLPAGTKTSRKTLDSLHTQRPIIVQSSFGHTTLANSRALELAHLTATTPDPAGGKIWHDGNGEPTGLLEDAAQEVFSALLPPSTPAHDRAAAASALKAMNAQGVTGFLDAMAAPESIRAFSALEKAGRLTARAHFAPVITPAEGANPDAAVRHAVALARRYNQPSRGVAPTVTVRNTKLFMDGVIAAPALTGNVVEAYRRNAGTADAPHWVAGTDHGPAVYFAPDVLRTILTGLARAGIDPHIHCDGDGAVHAALAGIEAMRAAFPDRDIRPAIAHAEIVLPADIPRFKTLDTTAVLSMQWEKPAGDTLGLVDYFGPERMRILEPAGTLAAGGARIAYGSDWPVDRLDEWFALKVGVTRANAPNSGYPGRLGDDPGLTAAQALRAITIGSAHELHADDLTGSLEIGKAADLVILDRNPLTVAPEDIANTKVLETIVGGKTVYQAAKH